MKTISFFTALALISAPADAKIFSMTCYPVHSTPYKVTYNTEARQAAIIRRQDGNLSGRTLPSMSRISRPNTSYMWLRKRQDKRVLFILRLIIPGSILDVSDIQVIDGAHDNMDKCESDDFQEAAAEALTTHRSVSRQEPLDRRVLIINQTQSDIIGIYASDVSSNEWGNNMIVSSHHDPVPSGGRVLADMDDDSGSRNCRYDLKAVLSNGDEVRKF